MIAKAITWTFIMILPAHEQVGIKENLTEKQCYETAVKATMVAKKQKVPMNWKCFKENDPRLQQILKAIGRHKGNPV